jgi:hypothetical protein
MDAASELDVDLEKTLDFIRLSAVGYEHYDVIVCLNDGVVVCLHNFVTTNNGIDGCAGRQFDIFDRAADNI